MFLIGNCIKVLFVCFFDFVFSFIETIEEFQSGTGNIKVGQVSLVCELISN